MLSWPCDFDTCDRFSLPISGDCKDCRKHLCAKHVALPHHDCLNLPWDARAALAGSGRKRELEALASKTQAVDLAASAQKLCNVVVKPLGPLDLGSLPQGGMNIHVPIELEDGRQWLARIRQQRFDSPPPLISRMIMDSEICTMVALRRGGVLVPEVHVPLLNSERTLNFFFLDKVEGRTARAPFFADLPPDQLSDLITSYAKASAQIANIPFTGIGSLHSSDQGEKVGPLISLEFGTREPPYFLGPFPTNKDRYLALIDCTIQRVSGGEGISEGAEGVYYTHLWLRDIVEGIEELGRVEPTFIKHADDKGDQVLADAENQVTGIIDWEWAYTVPKSEAFAAPFAVVDVDAFFNGSNELSSYEVQLAEAYDALGRADLGDCVRGGKLYQRLSVVIGQEPDVVLLSALQELVTGTRGETVDETEWVEGLRARYGGNMA